MNNIELTQHLALLEERLQALVDAQTPSAMSLVAQRLGDIQAQLAQLVPPQDVRASMAEATEHQTAMADAAPLQAEQLAELISWLHARMSGDQLAFKLEDLGFVTRQLSSILQGWRNEQLSMHGDIRRLAALCEQVLRGRVDDDERQWRIGDVERRRASGL